MKKNKKIAAIDIGSHNCRLMIVDKSVDRKKIIFNHSKPTNLIKNLSFNNEFNSENISKTLKDMLNYTEIFEIYRKCNKSIEKCNKT